MDARLDDLRLFVVVVEANSFSEAARRLSLPRPTVSRRVSQLERQLGVELLWRTTRKMRTTEVGQDFYARCKRVLREADGIEQLVRDAADRPTGTLRIAAPPHVGPRFLGPLIVAYLRAYPEVRVDVQIHERAVDVMADGYDVALRIGSVRDENLVARRVGTIEKVLCCHRDLVRSGAPDRPSDLHAWPFVVFSECQNPTVVVRNDAEEVEIAPPVLLFSNHFDVLVEAVRARVAAALLPRGVVADGLSCGELVQLLPDWSAGAAPLCLVYAGGRSRSPKVRALLSLVDEQAHPR